MESSYPVISNNKITGGGIGIGIYGASSSTITNNIIKGVQRHGIDFRGNSQPVISDNLIEENGITGINLAGYNSLTIKDNVIRNNTSDGIYGGVYSTTNSTIIGNTITENGRCGIYVVDSELIMNNKITANTLSDICLWPGVAPHISLNVFDTISGSGAVGNYNLKSDGTPVQGKRI